MGIFNLDPETATEFSRLVDMTFDDALKDDSSPAAHVDPEQKSKRDGSLTPLSIRCEPIHFFALLRYLGTQYNKPRAQVIRVAVNHGLAKIKADGRFEQLLRNDELVSNELFQLDLNINAHLLGSKMGWDFINHHGTTASLYLPAYICQALGEYSQVIGVSKYKFALICAIVSIRGATRLPGLQKSIAKEIAYWWDCVDGKIKTFEHTYKEPK